MDGRFNFLVTICVVLQVTWSASGLRLSLCNITSKSVPFKAPPKSPVIQNATPFQIGPPCPKCVPIQSSNEPRLHQQTRVHEELLSSINPSVSLTSPNGIVPSSKLLNNPSIMDANLNPLLLDLVSTENMLKNSPNNLETSLLSPLSNTQIINNNYVQNKPLFECKTAVVQNAIANTLDTNTIVNSLPINDLHSPLMKLGPNSVNNIAVHNSICNNPSINFGNVLKSQNEQSYVVNTGVTGLLGQQNVVLNNPAVTSFDNIELNLFGTSLPEYDVASKLANTLFNIELSSMQASPISATNTQGNILDKTNEFPISTLLTNQCPSMSSNKVTDKDNLSKLSGFHTDTSFYTNTPNYLQLNLNPDYPTQILPAIQSNTVNVNIGGNFSPSDNDLNNIDIELWTTTLNQLRNPVTIKNNENNVPITSSISLSNNHLKPIPPLSVSNNFKIMDFRDITSPFLSTNKVTSCNNVPNKHSKLVSTTPKPQASPPTSSIINIFPKYNSNNPINNILSHSTEYTSECDLKNPSTVGTEILSKAYTENNFAQFVQNLNSKGVVTKNMATDIPATSQITPYLVPLLTNLPKVNAPKYVQPQTVINYANTLPRVPQIDNLVSTSDLTKSLNEVAAEVVRRYFSLVDQKLASKPTTISSPHLKSSRIKNSVLAKTESGTTSQSEISNTSPVTPISSYISNHVNPYTSSNLIDSSTITSMPTPSAYLTDSALIKPTTSPIFSQSAVSSNEIEKLTSSSLIPHLSSLKIPEESPQIVVPAYLPTVDYQFLPRPTYPVLPSYPIPPVLPPILEAPIIRTGSKESQDFKKILEILVLNELINNNNECKDWGTLETIIALLCVT